MAQAVATLQRSGGNAAVARLLLGGAALHRQVTKFEAKTRTFTPPAADLAESLAYYADSFVEEESDIEAAIASSRDLKATMTDEVEVPTEIQATVDSERADYPTRDLIGPHIGAAGHDEFYIKRGNHEAFEGGHIIPNQVFDKTDSPTKSNTSENIVPMSRHMNIEEWKKFESELILRTVPKREPHDELIEDDEELRITIPISHQNYSRRLSQLARRFGLAFLDGAEDEDVALYGWIPTKIGPITVLRYKTMRVGSRDSDSEESEAESQRDLPMARESEFRREHDEITTGAELAQALEAQGWNISDDLLERVRGLI